MKFLLQDIGNTVNRVPHPDIEWISEKAWDSLCYLRRYPIFKGMFI